VCVLAALVVQAHGAEPVAPASAAATWIEKVRLAAEGLEWSDDVVKHEWRLQRRPGSDAWRILDPADACITTGDEAACRAEFARLEAAGRIPSVTGDAVIVLHGLGENRASMEPLVKHLRARLEATVLTFGYASPRGNIGDHGAALGRVVAGLPQAERISFVGHSLGNLVVRRWMHVAPAPDLTRVHRMVMLGAPNQGSDLARMTAKVWVLAALSHGAAKDLVLNWPEISRSLAVPACEFGIVAGGKGDSRGYSSLLEGDDDAVVRVAETKLDGARDFLLLPVSHAAMMKNPSVQEATVSFLETGRFGDVAAAIAPRTPPDE
jgi:hypothetical protein